MVESSLPKDIKGWLDMKADNEWKVKYTCVHTYQKNWLN